MSFTPEEKTQLIKDMAVVKHCVVDMSPRVEKNTKFRLFITGFFVIVISGTGLVAGLFKLKEAFGQEKVSNVHRSTKYYKQVYTGQK